MSVTTPPASPAVPDRSFGMLLTLLGRASNRMFALALEPIGLKPRHIAALATLREAPLTQQALGEATGTDPTKLVGLLNDLERWSLIVRRRDVGDRRRHIVEISPCGRERLAAVDRLVAESDERLLAGLDAADRDRLHALLRQVATAAGVSVGCSAMAAAADEDGGDCPRV